MIRKPQSLCLYGGVCVCVLRVPARLLDGNSHVWDGGVGQTHHFWGQEKGDKKGDIKPPLSFSATSLPFPPGLAICLWLKPFPGLKPEHLNAEGTPPGV